MHAATVAAIPNLAPIRGGIALPRTGHIAGYPADVRRRRSVEGDASASRSNSDGCGGPDQESDLQSDAMRSPSHSDIAPTLTPRT